jgi:hypothetical protein
MIDRYQPNLPEIAERAKSSAKIIAEMESFNKDMAEGYMRAFSGLFTLAHGTGITSEIYDKMPQTSRTAARNAADSCIPFLGETTSLNQIRDKFNKFGIALTEGNIVASRIQNAQTKASTMGVYNSGLSYRPSQGVIRIDSPFFTSNLETIGRNQALKVEEDVLRGVILVFGENIAPVIEGYIQVAPITDNLGAVRYAANHL